MYIEFMSESDYINIYIFFFPEDANPFMHIFSDPGYLQTVAPKYLFAKILMPNLRKLL